MGAPGLATLLLVADGRLPTGGHTHSGGLEDAVATGLVAGAVDLAAWLAGRLATAGRLDAAVAAAAWSAAAASRPVAGGRLAQLGAEWAARTASPAQRAAAVAQGRGLSRLAARVWPAAAVPAGAPWAVALGVVAAAAGLGAAATTSVAAAGAVSGPAWAATRLLSLDPAAVAAVVADLSGAVDAEADAATAWSAPGADLADLPADAAPLLELGAERHATREVRLFAS